MTFILLYFILFIQVDRAKNVMDPREFEIKENIFD